MDLINLKHRAFKKIKRTAVDLSFSINTSPLIYNRIRGNGIIMFHGVVSSNAKKYNLRHVNRKDFEKQIKWLKKYCNILSLDDYYNHKFSTKKFNVAITFDDGFQNVKKYALPILKKYSVPATIFVTGLNKTEHKIIWGDAISIINKHFENKISINGVEFKKKATQFYDSNNKPLSKYCFESDYTFKAQLNKLLFENHNVIKKVDSDYWTLLTDEEIKTCSNDPLISVQSHGWYHNCLNRIEEKEVQIELENSIKYLSNLTQNNVDTLAYPNGEFSTSTKAIANKLGLHKQVLMEKFYYKKNVLTDKLLTRYGIYPAFSWSYQVHELLTRKDY